MAYTIRKGWPAEGAIDEVLAAASGQTITPGMVVKGLNSSGTMKLSSATYAADGSDAADMAFFVIDADAQVAGNFTCIKSHCVIECDASHYNAGAYVPGAKVTATSGKFALHGGGNQAVLGQVIAYNATTGILRILWTAI